LVRFVWPEALWLLLAAPLLVGLYVLALRRRKKTTLRYASLLVVRAAISPHPSLRRHLPPALFLLAMSLGLLTLARPMASLTLPSENMTVLLAMDVSRSMLAADMAPNRISAAQAAVKEFVDSKPHNLRVGLVSFAGAAAVVQTPTTVREELIQAVDRFELQRGTATGAGLLMALSQLLPDAGIDVESGIFDKNFSRRGGDTAPLERRRQEKQPPKDVVIVPPGSYTGGVIVLLSDGRRTTGPDPLDVAKLAADKGVRVYTVGFGTKEGAEIPGSEGYSWFARLDEDALKGVAAMTGAEYFHAGNPEDLKKVYAHLNSKFSLEARETEVGALLAGLIALLLLAAGALSMRWFHRTA
jgi:Ca-activated chloride channel family protein